MVFTTAVCIKVSKNIHHPSQELLLTQTTAEVQAVHSNQYGTEAGVLCSLCGQSTAAAVYIDRLPLFLFCTCPAIQRRSHNEGTLSNSKHHLALFTYQGLAAAPAKVGGRDREARGGGLSGTESKRDRKRENRDAGFLEIFHAFLLRGGNQRSFLDDTAVAESQTHCCGLTAVVRVCVLHGLPVH